MPATTATTPGTHSPSGTASPSVDVALLASSAPTSPSTPPPAQRHSDAPERPLVSGDPHTRVRREATAPAFGDTVAEGWAACVRSLRDTPPLRLLWVALLVVTLITGNAMQIIFLNYWLRQFPPDGAPGNYTIFAVSGFMFSLFFLLALGLYVLVRRPSLRFVREWQGWKLLLFAGLMDTLNSGLAIYAASHTSEVLQALFVSMVPVYAALLTKSVLMDPRTYCNPWIVCSFTCIIGGIVIASAYHIGGGGTEGEGGGGSAGQSDSASDRRWWSLLFFISVPFSVLMNVGQTLYMARYTLDADDDADVDEDVELTSRTAASEGDTLSMRGHHGGATAGLHRPPWSEAASSRPSVYTPPPFTSDDTDHEDDVSSVSSTAGHSAAAEEAIGRAFARTLPPGTFGDDTTVKLVMLAGGTTVQFLCALLLLPLDALPWYGGSDSVAEAVAHFREGLYCLLHYPGNLRYGCLYSLGFVLVYVAAAYLNQYSVTLCSMVGQLSAPLTALVLIAFPALNLTGEEAPWPVSVAAVLLLAAGAFVYVVWDVRTEAAKAEGERQLRLSLLGLSARRPEYVLVVEADDGADGETVPRVGEG